MAKAIEAVLKKIEESGILYQELTAGEVFPCWGDSDPRLEHFPADFQSLSLPEVLKALKNPETLPMVWKRLRLFFTILTDGLLIWKEYEHYKAAVEEDVDLTDPVELAKFDAEFRRYLNRSVHEQEYEEDFEEEYEDLRGAENSFWSSTFDKENSGFAGTFEKENSGDVDLRQSSSTLSRGSDLSFDLSVKPEKPDAGCEDTLYEADSIEDPDETDSSPDPSQLETDDYQIIKFLGKGGEGKVFLAYSPSRRQHVALKQYEVEVQYGSELHNVLTRELEIMRKFDHPNVVRCFGLSNPPPTCDNIMVCSLVLEYIPGGSLADYIKHSGPMDSLEVKRVAKDVLQGLDYLHRHGLIHRDVKPSNILIGDEYKLTDFGLSAEVLEIESIARSCVGTPWYMAPEVIMQEPYSYSADIWSLACLLLELSTGERPFASASATKALHLMVDYESPLEFGEYDLDPEFRDFLEKCWRKQHTLRPSALELLRHKYLSVLD